MLELHNKTINLVYNTKFEYTLVYYLKKIKLFSQLYKGWYNDTNRNM